LYVSFLDSYLREYLDYEFLIIENEKIFLGRATYRQFKRDEIEPYSGFTFLFDQNGGLIVRRSDIKRKETQVGRDTIDVSRNYFQFPKFGEFEEILKRELWDE